MAITTSIEYANRVATLESRQKSVPKTFTVSVSFIGELPASLSCKIPLQIFVTVPEQFATHTLPVLRVKGEVQDTGPHLIKLEEDLDEDTRNKLVPFLPLSSTFDPDENWGWAALNEDVESWLISIQRDRQHPLWSWGLEIFWITFVAAYPQFPQGAWPQISPVIPVEGSFISSWVSNRSQEVRDAASILEDLWLEFRLLVFSLVGTRF